MRQWQIFSAVALRRLPDIVPLRDPIETRVQEIFSTYEIALSRYSDHELKHLEDIKPKGDDQIDVVTTKETAQDKEDRWSKEFSSFKFAPHEAKLSYCRYLFINQKFSTDIKDQWLLPQAIYDESQDQNLLDTGRRALKESLNIVNGYRIVSKIPSSVYSFLYPKKIKDMTGYDGAKVFFLKAHLDNPSISVLDSVDDSKHKDRLRWLTRAEAHDATIHKRYMLRLDKGIYHEDRVDPKIVYNKALKGIKKLRI